MIDNYQTQILSTINAHENNVVQTWAWVAEHPLRELAALHAGEQNWIQGCKKLWTTNTSAALAAFSIFPINFPLDSPCIGASGFERTLKKTNTVILCHLTEKTKRVFSFVVERSATQTWLYFSADNQFKSIETAFKPLSQAIYEITSEKNLSMGRNLFLSKLFSCDYPLGKPSLSKLEIHFNEAPCEAPPSSNFYHRRRELLIHRIYEFDDQFPRVRLIVGLWLVFIAVLFAYKKKP